MNKRLQKIAVFFLASMFLLSMFGEAMAQTIDFVFYQPNASFRDNKDAITAIRSLEKYLSGSLGGTVTGHLFQKETDLINYVASAKPLFGIIDIRYYVENKAALSLLPLVTPIRDNSSAIPAVVLVRRDSNVSNLLDMKGKSFATTGRGQVNDNFLSNLVFERQVDAGTFFQLKRVDSSNSALMAVLYKEAEIAVVDKVIFDQNIEQKDEFKVIFTTQPIPYPPLCVFEKNCSPEFVTKLREAFLKIHTTSEGKDFIKPLSIDRWESTSPEMYRATERLLTTSVSQLKKEPLIAETSGASQKMEMLPPPIPKDTLPVFAISEDFTDLLP